MACEKKTAGRIEYIDLAKGIGMLTVIWGHISGIFSCFIYAFHMPLFFFISGMMFGSGKYGSIRELAGKRAKKLLLPYLFYSVVTWCVWAAYVTVTGQVDGGGALLAPLLQTFIAQGSDGFLKHNVPLWFVTCLFVADLLYYFINKLPEWLNICVSVGLSVLGYLMIAEFTFFNFKLLPWSMEAAFAAVVFFAAGNILIKHVSHEQIQTLCGEHKLISLIFALCLGLCTYFGSRHVGHVSLGRNILRGGIVYYIDAFCGTLMILIISVLIAETFGTFRRRSLVWGIKWIGKYSFRVMAVHNPIKGFVTVSIARLIHNTTSYVSSSFLYSMISFAVTLTVVIAVVFLINKCAESSMLKKTPSPS